MLMTSLYITASNNPLYSTMLLYFLSKVTSLLPYISSVHDTTLSCVQLKLLCWLVPRELIKGIHFHPDLITTRRSTETVTMVEAPRGTSFHPDQVKLGDNGSVHDTTLSYAQLKLLCSLVHREPIKGITFSPDQTATWRRGTYRTSIRMVDIGRICLAV